MPASPAAPGDRDLTIKKEEKEPKKRIDRIDPIDIEAMSAAFGKLCVAHPDDYKIKKTICQTIFYAPKCSVQVNRYNVPAGWGQSDNELFIIFNYENPYHPYKFEYCRCSDLQDMLCQAIVHANYDQAVMALSLGASPNDGSGNWLYVSAVCLLNECLLHSDYSFSKVSLRIMLALMNHKDFEINNTEELWYDPEKKVFFGADAPGYRRSCKISWASYSLQDILRRRLESGEITQAYSFPPFYLALIYAEQNDQHGRRYMSTDVLVRLSHDTKPSFVVTYKIDERFIPAQFILDTLYQEGEERNQVLAHAKEFAEKFDLKKSLKFLHSYRSKESLVDEYEEFCAKNDEKTLKKIADDLDEKLYNDSLEGMMDRHYGRPRGWATAQAKRE